MLAKATLGQQVRSQREHRIPDADTSSLGSRVDRVVYNSEVKSAAQRLRTDFRYWAECDINKSQSSYGLLIIRDVNRALR